MTSLMRPSPVGDNSNNNNATKDEKAFRPKTTASRDQPSQDRRPTSQPQPKSQQVRPRTAEDITNEQTAEQVALAIWAAMVGEKVLKDMSALMDDLLQSHLLDDDDEEEANESWLDDQHEREKKLLDDAITDGLEKYPDIATINNLPPNADSDIAQSAKQLKDVLAKCAIGAIKFKEKFSQSQLEHMVRRDVKKRFENDPKYSTHVRDDVPGMNIKKYGSRGRTSSKGTFAKTADFESGGGLDALLTGGWQRVAKDRIDPVAWSYQFGVERKNERQNWRHVLNITERSGKQSRFALPRESLAGNGASAIRLLMKAGVHIVGRKAVPKLLTRFLGFKPRQEIIRMPSVGWVQVGSDWMFVRPDEVITPRNMPHTTYQLDSRATQHGLHIAGTTVQWATEIGAPLEGNSNVALSFATLFAAPLLRFANESGGGSHLFGPSTIGKTMVSAVAQSIYGWPYETADDTFGVSWGGSEAGSDALALARTDLGLPLDEITLANRRTAEQVVYKVASGTKGPRATSLGQLRETGHASVLVLSTGEKSLMQFIGPSLQEGARKRLVDVPAEVGPGTAFETIPFERIDIDGKRFFDAMKRQHGAVGRDWQRYLVDIGPDKIKVEFDRHCEAFLALPEVVAVKEKAHPQVRVVVNRFALLAAALRMVIEANKLLPWSIENADAGIVACMARWVAQRGNVDTAGEIVRAARQIERELLAGLNSDRFIHIRKTGKGWVPLTETDATKQQMPVMFDGYVKPDRILVRPEVWRRHSNGFDPADIAQHLKQRGVLIADTNGVSKTEQVIGKTERFTDPDDMATTMDRAECSCGCYVNIRNVLQQAVKENADRPMRAMIIVGDAFHDDQDGLYEAALAAVQLRREGTELFLIQQGDNSATARKLQYLARVSGGKYFQFDPKTQQQQMAEMLKVMSAYAATGEEGVKAIGGQAATLLLEHLKQQPMPILDATRPPAEMVKNFANNGD